MNSALIILGLLALVAWRLRARHHRVRRRGYADQELAHMPAELRTARLVLSEKRLVRHGRRPLSARFDQVFCTDAGILVPVETKRRRRAKVWMEDVIQLSAHAAILRAGVPRQWRARGVARYGYVRLAGRGGPPRYVRVRLLDEDQVAVLHDRWSALRDGRAPTTSPERGRCGRCPLRTRCPAAARAADAA